MPHHTYRAPRIPHGLLLVGLFASGHAHRHAVCPRTHARTTRSHATPHAARHAARHAEPAAARLPPLPLAPFRAGEGAMLAAPGPCPSPSTTSRTSPPVPSQSDERRKRRRQQRPAPAGSPATNPLGSLPRRALADGGSVRNVRGIGRWRWLRGPLHAAGAEPGKPSEGWPPRGNAVEF